MNFVAWLGLRRWKLLYATLIFSSALITYITIIILSAKFETRRLRCSPKHPCGLPLKLDRLLLNTSTCKIPDIGAYNEEVMPYFETIPSISCSEKPLLTYIKRHDIFYSLHINSSVVSFYSFFNVRCCYSKIFRVHRGQEFDDSNIRYTQCTDFTDGTKIFHDHILVKCRNILMYTVYINVYTLLQKTEVIRNKIQMKQESKTKESYSVTMIGIDSISNFNLIRSMPNTLSFLLDANFVTLNGYNKIEDNTYPNLLAILSGATYQHIYSLCDPATKPMDNKYLLWHDFAKAGYVTAYAEDWPVLSTFNYGRVGFSNAPTDYYFRPYFIAAHGLGTRDQESATVCTGVESTAKRMFNIAEEFTGVLREVPTFSLFWSTYMTHETINGGTLLDDVTKNLLEKLVKSGSVENTFLIFFSDHGFRFGEVRATYTGWLEERLPFIYIRFPEKFKKLHPEKYTNFLTNMDRLTTPYDLYMTLQEILSMSAHDYTIKPSQGCPKCHTLFQVIAENRTCPDAGILNHYCACMNQKAVRLDSPLVIKASRFAVEAINKLITKANSESRCRKFQLVSTSLASMSDYGSNSTNYLTLMFQTEPEAKFEATLEVNLQSEEPRYQVDGDISRIDKYGEKSYCVADPILRKYCYCKGWVAGFKDGLFI